MNTTQLIEKLQAEKRNAQERFNRDPKNKEIFGNNEEKPEDFEEKTFLFIRAIDTDNGQRPLPVNTVFWNSPDIELHDSSGAIIATNELTPNQGHTVSVLVHNEGDMSCNSCTVELFICDPTIGFDRSHATQIGIQNVMVLGHNTATVNFAFTPNEEQLGHQCLFACAYSYTSADMPNSANGFDTFNDRHIGQQNISIVSQGTIFDFFVFKGDKFDRQKTILKITQNPKIVKETKIATAARLTPIRKRNVETKFKFFNNIGPNALVMKKTYNNRAKTYLWRLMGFFKIKPNPTKYEAFKKSGTNTWNHAFTKDASKVSIQIPFLFMGGNEATGFEIEILNEETGDIIGGLTVIVKK